MENVRSAPVVQTPEQKFSMPMVMALVAICAALVVVVGLALSGQLKSEARHTQMLTGDEALVAAGVDPEPYRELDAMQLKANQEEVHASSSMGNVAEMPRPASGSRRLPAELVGTWSEGGPKIHIDPDGRYSSIMGTFKWRVEGNRLVLSTLSGEFKASYPFELSGNRLTITDEDRGVVSTLYRE